MSDLVKLTLGDITVGELYVLTAKYRNLILKFPYMKVSYKSILDYFELNHITEIEEPVVWCNYNEEGWLHLLSISTDQQVVLEIEDQYDINRNKIKRILDRIASEAPISTPELQNEPVSCVDVTGQIISVHEFKSQTGLYRRFLTTTGVEWYLVNTTGMLKVHRTIHSDLESAFNNTPEVYNLKPNR